MTPEVTALADAYGDLAALTRELDEPRSWQPTGCSGWAVRDLVHHLLGDAQRALVALHSPAAEPPDRDHATYWSDAPGQDDPESRGLRATRTMASAWRLDALLGTYRETAAAVVRCAAEVAPGARVATQGHVLLVDHLVATLVVEAGLHHLDLVAHLDLPGPRPRALAVVRQTLDAVLGRPCPLPLYDAGWALVATGRRPPTVAERELLGLDADRLPLLG
ncbi:MAG TPA: maleylpyruvate isomerase N-terminal domain-containing protein [Actinomycetales bacterium]